LGVVRTALQTAAAIRAGETSALAECEAAIARIEAGDGPINAVVVRDFDRARAVAKALDEAGADAEGNQGRPLFGVPMTVKESFDVAGLPTHWGFPEHADHMPAEDAVAVKRLKAAGAVILGKTNTPTNLDDIQTNNPVHGRTNNPHDHSRVSGGSSGGSAASLAAGFVPLELGSDIGGSIRVPAAFCGVWGLKTSYGALDSWGHTRPRTRESGVALNVIGPMARDAADLHVALDVLSDLPLPHATPASGRKSRVLILPAHPLAPTERAVSGAVERVGDLLEQGGVVVDRASPLLPDLGQQHANYIKMLLTALARGQGTELIQPLPLTDWFELVDEQAENRRAWGRFFAEYDAVVAPCWGTTAFPHDDTPFAERQLMVDGEPTFFGAQMAYPGLATFPMLPACSVPVGRDGNGLPIGVQVMTDFRQDHRAIAVARLVNQLTMG
jgi:amidase